MTGIPILQLQMQQSQPATQHDVLVVHKACEGCESQVTHVRTHMQRTLAATTSDTPSMGEATKGIMQKARMAKDLYEQQAAIENQVKERCAQCSFFASRSLPHTPIVLSANYACASLHP